MNGCEGKMYWDEGGDEGADDGNDHTAEAGWSGLDADSVDRWWARALCRSG